MQQPITLFYLNTIIKESLDKQLSPTYWVIAEIGELREAVRGHAYLDLVEKTDGQIRAKMRGNIWSYSYQAIKQKFEGTTGQRLQAGMNILALVNVQFHELYGISLVIKDIDPNFTLGERARRRQEVIDRLKSEDILHLNKQFILPAVSQKIAIISSVTAAGYGDFIDQLDQNTYGYRIHYRLYQAAMQGNAAGQEIIAAIKEIEKAVPAFDLIVLIRGGGAQTDLDCFDEYDLAKTIANAGLPVITGIGHERDESVADLVAHTQLKTPTAVASFILSGFRAFEESLHHHLIRIERLVQGRLRLESEGVMDKLHLLKNLFQGKLNEKTIHLDRLSQQSLRSALYTIEKQSIRVSNDEKTMIKASGSCISKAREKLQHLEKTLHRLNPDYLLSRGYTKTEKDGIPIHLQELKEGDELDTFSQRQKITSVIKKIDKK
ncbi:Exodeoxyribonuclease VII large subunit [Cyclobacterium lianum]|uniref:Exodeoxyribonuclease 7 large subunit n=2 Tax=Cyclobacterium lianum TaxID=388280 RepID=A0A1M7MLM8_9BACT|nr:Exodeoxyribonuclease VII large subunit [Cyclobacterium lianum]